MKYVRLVILLVIAAVALLALSAPQKTSASNKPQGDFTA